MQTLTANVINILLTDDDEDDCSLFKDALEDLPLTTSLTILHNGEQLLQELTNKATSPPFVIFLDMNMPRKNGYDSLLEIKRCDKLKHIPVIIFSTACNPHTADLLYKAGAHFCIVKPAEYSELKETIYTVLTLVTDNKNSQPTLKNFVINHKPT